MRSLPFARWGVLPIVLLLVAGVDPAYGQAFVSTDRTDYTDGDVVLVTGWGWEPGETVILTFNEDPETHDPVILSALANGDGMFTNNDFLVTADDEGVRFTLEAVGETSGLEARTFFADAPWITITWDPLVPGQNPNPVQPGGTATYSVRVKVQIGSPLQVALSIVSGLPAGASAAFSPDVLSFDGSTMYGTTELEITTGVATPLGDHAVVFRAEKVGASSDYYDHIAVLSVRDTPVQFQPWLEIPPQQQNERFALNSRFVSDFNADGYPDAVIGTYTAPIPNGVGHAYMYYGGPAADNVPDLVFASGIGGDRFGEGVIDAGDLNADGQPDIAVSACAHNGYQGRVYVYFGGPGADNVPDRILTGTSGGAEHFASFRSLQAGDVNGDGFNDLGVGAPWADGNKGRAYVFYGGPGFDTTPDLTYYSPPPGGMFGYSAGNIGDLNGDGLEDMAIGATWINGNRTGQVIVYFGARPPDTVPDLTMSTNSPFDYFPTAIRAGGDLNGDGYDDLVVRNSEWPNEWTSQGRCLVYFGGPGLDATPDLVLTGEARGDKLGPGGPVGDINGDGYGDLVVHGPYNDFGGPDVGRLYFYFGGPLLDAIPDLTLCGAWPGEAFGYGVCNDPVDFNSDGVVELLIGAFMNSEEGSGAGKAYMISIISPEEGLDAIVDMDPNALNLKSEGKHATCYIELPEGYDPSEIDVSTVLFEGLLPAIASPSGVGDYDEDGVPDRMVKFDRGAIIALLSDSEGSRMWLDERGAGTVPLNHGDEFEVSVSGELTDGTEFLGTDVIRVINPGGGAGNAAISAQVLRVFPSPLDRTAMISYNVTLAGHVTLRVYDAAGRLVRTLENDQKSAGRYVVEWNRKTDDGRQVSAGVYFMKLEQPGRASVERVLVVR